MFTLKPDHGSMGLTLPLPAGIWGGDMGLTIAGFGEWDVPFRSSKLLLALGAAAVVQLWDGTGRR